MQIVIPGSEDNAKIDGKINEIASKINSAFGSLEFTPVQMLHQSVDSEEYYSLLSAADILLITSERDSVDSIVLDYIACQEDHFGMPIISEFVGLAEFLPSQYTVNPWDYAVQNVLWPLTNLFQGGGFDYE